VEGTLLDRLVDPRDELAMLVGDRRFRPGVDGALESPEMGAHGALKAPVLEPLTLGAVDPLDL
jgi:hypothetical protein